MVATRIYSVICCLSESLPACIKWTGVIFTHEQTSFCCGPHSLPTHLYDIPFSLLKSKHGGLKGFVYNLDWSSYFGGASRGQKARRFSSGVPPVNVPCMTGVGLVLFDSSSRLVPSALYIPSDQAVSLMDLWCFLIVLNMIMGRGIGFNAGLTVSPS